MKKTFLALFAAAFLCACGGANLEGTWVQPVPGMEGQTQGFALQKDGAASSINMATLVYERWSAAGNTLTLTGKSIGNGRTIEFVQTYTYTMPQRNTLVLNGENGTEQTFTRK